MNLARLSRETGIDYSTVSKVFHGHRRMTKYMAGRLAPALGVNPADLLPPAVEEETIGSVLRLLHKMDDEMNEARTATAYLAATVENRLASIEGLLRRTEDPGQTSQQA